MEPQPADARAAPSACAPTTLSMAMPLPPSHPRSPVKGNMVSPTATHAASTWPEHQHETTACAPRGAHASHCQSLAHHTTLTGRCFKSVDCWVPLYVELQGRSNIIQYAARQLIIKTAVTPRAQLGSCQSLAHQATCAFMRFLSSDCWAPLNLEPQGRSTIVQSTIDHKSLDENVLFDETEADSTHRCSAGKKMTPPSASQVKAHSFWPQTTSLARGDPTSPSWRQLGKHTSAHQPIDKGGQRSAPQECAPHFPPPASSHYIKTRAIAYARVFDATLGFPGEGPLLVATYNINGSRGSLAAVLAQAKQG
jgi:hypothetical protein